MGCKSPKEPKKFEFEEEEEKQNDNNQNDNNQNDNKQSDDNQNDNNQNDDKQNDDNQNDNKQNDNKQGDDKQGDDKQNDDKQNLTDEKKEDEKKADEKKDIEKKADEKKDDAKKEDEKKDDKKEIKFIVPENKTKYEAGKPLGITLELKNIKEEDVELKYHQVEMPDKTNPLSGVRTQKYSKDFKLDAKELVEKKWYMIMAHEKISISGFSSNVKPPVVTLPIFFYIGEKNPEEEKKEEKKETLVCYGGGITEDSKKVVSEGTIQLLKRVGEKIEQDVITITGTILSPKQQAEQIYNNMEKGNNIAYNAPGEAVKNVWRKCRGGEDKLLKEDTVKKMTDKIEELAKQNQHVTPHCVSEEVYKKLNVIDISYNNLKVQEFINALCEEAAVKQVLHGKQEITNPAKAKYNAGENGVHVEILH